MRPDDRWRTVKFEELGANVANADFEGLIGFEECHDYGVLSSRKDAKKKRKAKSSKAAVAKKKQKVVSEDFKVEVLDPNASLTPSRISVTATKKPKVKKIKKVTLKVVDDDNKDEVQDASKTAKPKKKTPKKKKSKESNKKTKSNGQIDDASEVNGAEIPMEDMQAWSAFGIPEPIMKALADQGFEKPTMIQELTIPAAMHGRRDILGAAETGSGKTLAFGIPILSGILRLKEQLLSGDVDGLRGLKRDMYALEESEDKIVNMNKLSEEEIRDLRRPQRKNKWNMKNSMKNIDTSDQEEDGSDNSNESDDDSVVDDDVSQQSEDENEVSSSATEDALSNDELSMDSDHQNESDIDDIVTKRNKIKPASDDESTQSDFEEREEEGNALNSDGIGCVKVIDNIPSIESNQTVISMGSLKPLYALILTPTRELAIQVKNHLVAAAKHSDIRIAVVVGGMAQVKQERILSKGPEIVVATPGRLWEMIQQGNNHLSQINDITYLAIDETDRMIERGHFEELHHILDQINDNEEKKLLRQNFVFSATLTMVHDLPFHLKSRKVTKKGKIIKKKYEKLTSEQKLKKVIEELGITNPKVVDVTTSNRGSSNTLTECRISCPIDYKDYYLYYVLRRHPGRTIVFCNSIGCVKRLGQLFSLLQCKPLPLHSNMQQRQRLKNLDRFRADTYGLLIATDIAARGLDIPNVEHVIHYQVPRTAENYVHRSGRTARASKEGITILIMEPGEVQNYVKLCRTLSKVEDLPHFPVPDALLSATKERVNLAREVDQLELKMRKKNSEVGWYEKSMREMDIVLDEREMPQRMDKDVAADLKSSLTIKKKQLNGLLGSHLFPKGYSFKYPSSNSAMEDDFVFGKKQNALEAMKSAMESGLIKKLKKSTKNQAHLSLAKKDTNLHKVNEKSGKVSKNKLKKMKRNDTSK